jgi:hypothetical protein
MKKEEFIETVLNSTSKKILAAPNANLLKTIYARMEAEKQISNPTKWLVAATVTILFGINASVLMKQKSDTTSKNELAELVSTSNNQLY